MSPVLHILMLVATTTTSSPCQPVAGPRIMGSDLAAASPALATLPANLVAGFAPQPGSQRVFTTPELMRIAQANGIVVNSPAAIGGFERAHRPRSSRQMSKKPCGIPASAMQISRSSSLVNTRCQPADSFFPGTCWEPSPPRASLSGMAMSSTMAADSPFGHAFIWRFINAE